MCDRIYTMSAGRITGEVPRAEATQEVLMRQMTKDKEVRAMSTDVTAKSPAPAPAGRADRPRAAACCSWCWTACGRNMRQYGMLIALGLIVILFAVWTDGDLLLPRNVSNLVLQNSYILILAIGMMLVIIAGHIDLSVGSLTAFVGAFAAVLMVNHHVPWPSRWCCAC
jgi:putative multiple sugar transport system permease protein